MTTLRIVRDFGFVFIPRFILRISTQHLSAMVARNKKLVFFRCSFLFFSIKIDNIGYNSRNLGTQFSPLIVLMICTITPPCSVS